MVDILCDHGRRLGDACRRQLLVVERQRARALGKGVGASVTKNPDWA